jgi:hypothetical protein
MPPACVPPTRSSARTPTAPTGCIDWAVFNSGRIGTTRIDLVQLLVVERVPHSVLEVDDDEGRLPIHRIDPFVHPRRGGKALGRAPTRNLQVLAKGPRRALSRRCNRATTSHEIRQSLGPATLVELLVEAGPDARPVGPPRTMTVAFPFIVRPRTRSSSTDAIRFLVSPSPESVRAIIARDSSTCGSWMRCRSSSSRGRNRGLEPAANGWLALHLALLASPPPDPAPALLERVVREMVRLCPASIRFVTLRERYLPLHVAAQRAFQSRYAITRRDTEANAERVRFLAEQAPEAVRTTTRDGSLPLHLAL